MDKQFEQYKFDKKDFEYVQLNERIFDTKFDTKAVSYFADAWIRFRRNKASIIAFGILIFIIFMSLVGPFMSPHSGHRTNARITFLPPRVPILENFGFLDGTREYTNVPEENLGNASFPEGAYRIINGPYFNPRYNRYEVDVIVDMYLRNFGERMLANLSTSAFNDIDPNVIVSYEQRVTTINGVDRITYDVVVDYAKYLGFDSVDNIYYFFGSDAVGRDLWTRLWEGVRVSLLIGVIVAVINLSIGIIWGSVSGYYGGTIDLVMERVVEIISGIPWIAVMTLVILYLGRNMSSIVISLILTSWIGTASMVRMQFYRYKGQEYVLAARTLGAKDPRIMFRHILPNAIGPIVTASVLVIPSAIFFESTLSYLGLGLQNGVSIGILLANGQSIGITAYPHLTVFPAVIISILMIAFNLFGNGLRDALNPSLRGVE